MAEMKAFVFAVSFIVIFSSFIITIPADLQGQEGTIDPVLTPIDPTLLTDFSVSEAFNTTDFSPWYTLEIYEYVLSERDWICGTNGTAFDLNAKIYFLGYIWLGQLEPMRFKTLEGVDRGLSITFDEMETDAEDGTVRYNLIFAENGNSAGSFMFYWNTTTYTDSSDAWDNNALYFLHGMGITADTNIVSLLLALLFLQIPDVPLLISVLLATALWANILYLLWFIIISMIPFLGGA